LTGQRNNSVTELAAVVHLEPLPCRWHYPRSPMKSLVLHHAGRPIAEILWPARRCLLRRIWRLWTLAM